MALSHHSQDSHAYLLSQFVAYPFPLAQWPFLCPFRGIIILTKIIWGGFCILYGGVDHKNPPTMKKLPSYPPFSTTFTPLVRIIILAKSYLKIFLSLFVFLYPFPSFSLYIELQEKFDLWVTSQGQCHFLCLGPFLPLCLF